MASLPTAPFSFPFLPSPDAFTSPIPTQIDPNWAPYAPTQIHGDLHHTSFPFFSTPTYSPSPSFSSAATYHHHLPIGFSTAYTPPSAVSPPPPPAPTPTPSTAPSTFGVPASGSPPIPPPPACPYAHTTALAAPAYDPSTIHLPYSQVLAPPPETTAPPSSEHGFIPTQASQTAYCPNQPPPSSERHLPLCSRPMLQQQKDSPTTSWPEPSPALDLEKSKPSAEAQVRAEANISKDMPRAVLDLKRRLDELQARDRTSFDKLRGELAKLTSMATQLAISIGKQSSAAESSSATAYVAQHVFDKMPTPNSGFENCSGYSNPIQSSCVQGGSTNLSEQHIDGLPHHYGFDNLKRQSLFLADGSQHSYYTLPENYPLERAVTEPMRVVFDEETNDCSNEFIQVFTGTTEHQNYEVEQHESRQGPKCFSKPTFSPVKPTVGIVDVFSLTRQLNPDNELCGKHVKPQVINQQWNMLSTEAERKEWDPGVLNILDMMLDKYTVANNVQFMQRTAEISFLSLATCIQYVAPKGTNFVRLATCFILRRAAHLTQDNYLSSLCCKSVLKTSYVWDLGLPWYMPNWWLLFTEEKIMVGLILDQWSSLFSAMHYCQIFQKCCAVSSQFLLQSHSWYNTPIVAVVYKVLILQLPMSTNSHISDPGILNIMYMMLDKYTAPNSVQFIQWTVKLLFVSLTACIHYMATNGINFVLHATSFILQRAAYLSQAIRCYFAFNWRWTKANAAAVLVLAVPCSTGKHSLFLANGGNRRTNHSFLKLFCLAEWVRHTITVLSRWFPSFEMATLQWNPGIGKPSSIYLWLEGWTAWTEAEKPLSWLPIEELTKWQGQMTTLSFVWDPGTMLLSYKCKWWLLYAQEKINWLTETKSYGVALWLVHFLPP